MKTGYRWFLAGTLLAMQGSATAGEELVFGGCEASASMEYFQRGAEADVKAKVDNADCAASSGSFVVEVTIRADGETESVKLRFEEEWHRDDDAPVDVERRYPIGDDVDLLRVRIRKLSCDCAADDTSPASPPDAQPGA
jgi:hypothetical protein